MSYEDENKQTETSATAALAVAATSIKFAGDGAEPFVIVPDGHHISNVEDTLPAPVRKSGITNVRDAKSFIALFVRNEIDATTLLYYTVEPPTFVAIFNDHSVGGNGQAGWGDHRLVYDCPLSPEWKTWVGSHKKAMKQSDFAQFIEDNLPDVVEPAGATMLEISRRLEARKKVNFTSGLRLDNGEVQFQYEEQIEGRAGPKGAFTVPEKFVLGIPVFENGTRYAVTARFRYRIGDGGDLVLWYDLERHHKIVEDAVAQLQTDIEAETGVTAINGYRID